MGRMSAQRAGDLGLNPIQGYSAFSLENDSLFSVPLERSRKRPQAVRVEEREGGKRRKEAQDDNRCRCNSFLDMVSS